MSVRRRPGERPDRARPVSGWVALALVASLLSSAVEAKIRFQSNKHKYICRVVVTVDNGRSERKVYDGPVRRGDFYTYRGGEGYTVCVQRSEVPQSCGSRLTRRQCMVDTHSNRTLLFNVR